MQIKGTLGYTFKRRFKRTGILGMFLLAMEVRNEDYWLLLIWGPIPFAWYC